MTDDIKEYVTFTVQNRAGQEIEMAVMDEFEFEHRQYVVGALIENDTINEDGLYIYRAIMKDDDFTAVKIADPKEYKDVIAAYASMMKDE